MYFLVYVLIKITILVEIPSRPGRRELPICKSTQTRQPGQPDLLLMVRQLTAYRHGTAHSSVKNLMSFREFHSIFSPVDCVWDQWEGWNTCSSSCGDGWKSRSRYRHIEAQNGGLPCKGGDTEHTECKEKECPGTVNINMSCSVDMI